MEDRKEDSKNVENNKIKITYSDDIDAVWLVKRGKYHYGYKGHNVVNYDGYFLGGHVTGANISDINQLEKMIIGSNLVDGTNILADKGYMSKKNVELLDKLNMKDGIMRKAFKNKELTNE